MLYSGEKPYICTSEGCGKRFTEYSSLYKHHVVHTHKKPYECADCGKMYRQISTLAMHRRMTHSDVSSTEPATAAVSSAFFLTSGEYWVHVDCLLISAPSLGVYYFLSLTLSICLSGCLSVTLLQIASSFLFLDGIGPFFGRHFSMWHSTKRCSSISDLGP